MARVELIMPKMGESIMEATILKWRKKPGDRVELDEPVLDIATDKVDSEVPSPVEGILAEVFYKENDVVPINTVIAIIETEAATAVPVASPAVSESAVPSDGQKPAVAETMSVPTESLASAAFAESTLRPTSQSGRFYSPLVRTIARQEGISQAELDRIPGTGLEGRVTKKDILAYVQQRKATSVAASASPATTAPSAPTAGAPAATPSPAALAESGNVEIIEMDRMRRLIAEHMVMSKQTSPHVTSFVEADVTSIVMWRNRVKDEFRSKYGENITYTPLFIEAIVRAIRDFPLINSSVDGTRIIVKKDIHIGMATALPNGNLIVPVIRNADHLNLIGLTKVVNDLAHRARQNQLKPDEIQGGTFTLTNVGTFGNVMGTPIIHQPQVAILATGAIRKKPAVIETEYGDVIAIRHMMFLSLSYDHRIIDGMLGGSFLRRVADYLEQFDANRSI
ncbi:MAG: 2-oxo acid dehydrogenase subunit E2 [Saprospiraceae bacterium]|nr:2-oxo acid dehydrogenase subunit E2 [Saprospiraceae bacterium]MDW8484131.1 dihydrolipoamide acetyltransferase family protein [Saprospiraceae bacterium]